LILTGPFPSTIDQDVHYLLDDSLRDSLLGLDSLESGIVTAILVFEGWNQKIYLEAAHDGFSLVPFARCTA
jgi:hypothetical protein